MDANPENGVEIMRTLTRKERLTGQIGISLLAGMFSMVPVAFGMPVYDATYAANSEGVAITKPEANRMDVTGSTAGGHYVAAWTDFSVAQGEKVTFDGGAIGQSDYLNLVTGQATSDIAGTIEGGRNVYLVNPNGVIFAEGAQVNVGSLYVSTQKPDTVDVSGFQNVSSTSPLGANPTGNADVVNLGTIKADRLTIVGDNVSLQNSAEILTRSNEVEVNKNNVAITAAGYVHIGHEKSDDNANSKADSNVNYTISASDGTTYYQLVSKKDELEDMATDGHYMLKNDIAADSFIPKHISASAPFTGKFDGMYHQVTDINAVGGLFSSIKNATIENVGVVGGSISAATYSDVPYLNTTFGQSSSDVKAAGALAGYATGDNKLHNVYNEGVSVTGNNSINGGLVGLAGVGKLTISESYNTGTVTGSGTQSIFSQETFGAEDVANYGRGGIVGYARGNEGKANGQADVIITNVYNTGATKYGIIGGNSQGTVTAATSYTTQKTDTTTGGATGGVAPSGLGDSVLSTNSTSLSGYAAFGDSISNEGGSGKTWRIYEGRTTPLLTAFFKGTATVNLNENNVSNAAQITTANGLKNSTTLASTLHFESGKVSKTYDARTINLSLSKGDVSSNAHSTVVTAPAGKAEGTYAMAYTGQHGYDLVGGEAKINLRPVYLGTTGEGANQKQMLISKTYDGSATFKGSATDLLTASAGETGLVQGDDVEMPGSVVGNFYNNKTERQAAPDAGTGKYVELTFTGLGSKLKGNAAGNYALNKGSDVGTGGDITINTIKGAIIPRALNVRLNQSKDIDKTYDGTDDVVRTDTSEAEAETKGYRAAIDDDITDGVDGNLNFANTVGLTAEVDDGNGGTQKVSLTQGFISENDQKALRLIYNDTVAYDDVNASINKNDRKIDYKGLMLGLTETGKNRDDKDALLKNYYLTDGTSVIYYGGETLKDDAYGVTFLEKTNADKGGKLTATGTIARRVIDTSGIQITGTSSTKNYDGGSTVDGIGGATVTVDHNAANILADDVGKITFSVKGGSFVDSTKTHAAVNATDSGIADSEDNGYKAQHISYDVKVSSDDANVLNNYTFVTDAVEADEDATEKLTALNGGTVYNGFFQDGTITRRTINVSLSDDAKDINKDYDGTTDVITDVDYKGYVLYTDPNASPNSVFEQDSKGMSRVINAAYDSPDINWVDGSNVNTNKITYAAGLTGTKAGNYQLYDAVSNVTKNADVEGGLQLGRKATGTISPRTVSIQGVSKVYDGSKDVTGASVISLSGTLDRDAGLVAVGAGSGSAYADKNVGAGKNVSLVGLALSGNRAGNYALDSSSYTGNVGTITPRTISTSDVSLVDGNGQTIAPTKAYDGTTGYSVPTGATLKSASILNGDDVSFAIVDADFNDRNATDYVRPSQDFPSPGAHWVRYAVQAQGNDAQNYSFVDGATVDQGLKTDGTTYGKSASGDYDASAFWTSGTITPRTIKLAIKDGAIEKTYDGTANVLDTDDNGSATHYLQFRAGDDVDSSGTYDPEGYLIYGTDEDAHKFLASDLNGTNPRVSLNISNVHYDDKNVLRDAANNVISGKQVSYTVSLDGDYKGNYQLETNSTAVRTSWEGDGAGYTYTYTKNNGRINPREVQAVFSHVDKIYNGTAKVEVPDGYALTGENVTFLQNGVADTVANGELDQISFNKNALTGDYTDGKNVLLDGNGKAAAKGITFAEGAVEKAFVNAGNYTVTDAGTSTGTILPRPVGELELYKDGVRVTEAAAKTYNGSDVYEGEALGDEVRATTLNVEAGTGTSGIIADDSVELSWTNESGYKSYYADADGNRTRNATGYQGAGTGAQRVIYAVKAGGADVSNYTLEEAGSLNPMKAGVNYGKAGSVVGTIDRRDIYVELGTTTGIDKEYDGSASVVSGTDSDTADREDFGGNYIRYADGSATLVNDGAKWDISAKYQAMSETNRGKDVYRDTNGNPSVKNITYTVSLTGDAAGNYRLNGHGTEADPVAQVTFNAKGTITPKTVNIAFKDSSAGITKVYDGTTEITPDLLKAGTKVEGKVTYPATETTPETADDVYAAVSEGGTLAYSGKNVGVYGPDSDDAGEIVLNSGTILLGGTDAGNYTLGTVSDLKGTIKARKLYVDFKNTEAGVDDGTGIDKVYDKTTTVSEPYLEIVGFADVDEADTGLVEGDTGKVGLTYSAHYRNVDNTAYDENVERDNEGKVLTRQVWYQEFVLTGEEAGNYALELVETSAAGIDSDLTQNILKGTGTIKPIEAEISLVNKVRKTYDGTDAVADTYKTIENINRTMLDEKLLLTGDAVNLALQTDVDGGARYTSKDAGHGVGVDYFLTWDDQNYELVPVPTSDGEGVLTTKYDRATNTVYATYTSLNGIIDPAKIRGLVATPAEKTYDGTDRLMGSDAGAFIQSKYLEDVFYDEDLDITANGVYRGGIDADTGISYSGAAASLTEASTDPISHAVSYTGVQIRNPNYYLEGVDTYDTNTGDINRGSIELESSGIIRRAEVTVTAKDATTTKGVWPSSYSGSWSGVVDGDADFDANDFTFDVTRAAVDINTVGTYPDAVTGWFRNKSGITNLTSGNYGQNYYIKEFNPGNFIVNEPSSPPSPGGSGSGSGGSGGGGGSTPAGGGGSTPTGGGGGIPSILPPPGSNPTPGGEHGGTGENPGTGGNVEPGGPGTGPGGSGGSGTGPGGSGGSGTGPGGSGGSGGSGTGLDGISSNGSGMSWEALLELGGTGTGGTANGAVASTIATASAVLAESGSKKVTPDNTILVQVSESEGLAETANAAEMPYSSASVAYKSTGVNAADLSGTGQIVEVSSNADVDSEIALESSAGSVSISNDSNTESDAELEYSDATVNITTKDGTKSSISLSTSEDGVNLSTGAHSDATTKTKASSSEQTETSSGISIRVQKDDTEEDTETGEENRSKTQDSSLIGLETLKDAVNLGAPMDTAV